MDEMRVILIVVLLIVGILNLVLWFKIWFMTNNVKKITTMMEDHFNPPWVVEKEVKKVPWWRYEI
jgi:hypothetical protein